MEQKKSDLSVKYKFFFKKKELCSRLFWRNSALLFEALILIPNAESLKFIEGFKNVSFENKLFFPL